jgi:phosphoribosylformylglycinamidine cyclo-ligase
MVQKQIRSVNTVSFRYAQAGVDVEAGYRAVELMKKDVESTFIPGVLGSLGGFGGLFQPDLTGIKEPVLVSGNDGVGTKIKLAFALDKHDTVGIDCVAMCVNDVACTGAKPLFFLDYIGIHKTVPETVAAIVSGIAEGCRQAGCALIGGETAEMPGIYKPGEYDLVGFCVGIADKSQITDKSTVTEGDAVIGLPSSGVHSNGFTLIRQVFDCSAQGLSVFEPSLGMSLGDALMTPTKIYSKALSVLRSAVTVKGICHITGGGFYENIPRMLPPGLSAKIDLSFFPLPPVFSLLAQRGQLGQRDLYNTFNMGLGMLCCVNANDADNAVTALRAAGEEAYIVGKAVKSDEGVIL